MGSRNNPVDDKMTKTETEIRRYIKQQKEEQERKQEIFLPPEFDDNRILEFTQQELDDFVEQLESKPPKKFSVTLPSEYINVLDDIAKRDSKRFKFLDTKRFKGIALTRTAVIQMAVEHYICERGYLVTTDVLRGYGCGDTSSFIALIALCKGAKKIKDLPSWVRGYWQRLNMLHGAEYIGDDDDKVVDKWFNDVFSEGEIGRVPKPLPTELNNKRTVTKEK